MAEGYMVSNLTGSDSEFDGEHNEHRPHTNSEEKCDQSQELTHSSNGQGNSDTRRNVSKCCKTDHDDETTSVESHSIDMALANDCDISVDRPENMNEDIKEFQEFSDKLDKYVAEFDEVYGQVEIRDLEELHLTLDSEASSVSLTLAILQESTRKNSKLEVADTSHDYIDQSKASQNGTQRRLETTSLVSSSGSEMWRSSNGKTYEQIWPEPKCLQISICEECDINYFDFLPIELVIKIFSCLTTQEICKHVSTICRKWRQISLDQSLWKCIDFSTSPNISTLNFLWIIRRAPLLQRLNVSGRSDIKRAEVAIFTECCVGLQEIDFGFCDNLSGDMIKSVSENCAGVRKLNVEGCEKLDQRAIRYIAKCKKLNSINFSHCILQDSAVKYLADKLACIRCINLDGIADITDRNCDGITYIVDVAQGIKSGSQLKSAKAKITATLKDLKKEMVLCKKYIADLVNDKSLNIQQVKDLTERLIKRIRELEKLTIKQIDSTFKEHSDEAGANVTHLDSAISVMEEDLTNFDHSKQNSESTVFVDVKLGQRHEAEGRQILQQVVAHHKTSPRLFLKTDVEHFLNDLTNLGNVHDTNKVYTAKLKGNYTIKVKKDRETCDSAGSCLLHDGTLVVTDWNNKRLKRLDTSYSVTGHCDMPDQLYGVTCTAPDEVAVTLINMNKVQFVSVRGSMSLTRSFSTSDKCRGICYSAGELFVAFGGNVGEGPGHVDVYNINGARIRTIQTDPSGQQLFSLPEHITASPDGARIYVADYYKGVVSSDRSGKSASSYTDPSLKNAYGVCTLDNGHVLVCGLGSHNVLQFDCDGLKIGELLKATAGIESPLSLSYDKNNSRLIVTMHRSNNIKVFDLV